MKNYRHCLLIGNSFTYYHEMPQILKQILLLNNIELEISSYTRGGMTLFDVVNPLSKDKKNLDSMLNNFSDFDLCIIQEYSTRPYTDRSLFEKSVNILVNKLKSIKKDIDIYLYETFAFPLELKNKGISYDEMENRLLTAYQEVASYNKIHVIQVGTAFKMALKLNPRLDLYDDDEKHPSLKGSRLIALTIAMTIYQDKIKNYRLSKDSNEDELLYQAIKKLQRNESC